MLGRYGPTIGRKEVEEKGEREVVEKGGREGGGRGQGRGQGRGSIPYWLPHLQTH